MAAAGPRGLDPEATTVTVTVTTARPDSLCFQRRWPRSGDYRSWGGAEESRREGPATAAALPAGVWTGSVPSLEGALWSPPRERRLTACVEKGRSGLAIDGSALPGATWEREEHSAQARGLPRGGGVHSFQVRPEKVPPERGTADDTPRRSARRRSARFLPRGAQLLGRLL